MITLRPNMSEAVYDEATDVMYFGVSHAKYTDEREAAPGIHVLYAYDGKQTDEIVGVEIEYFNERYGNCSSISVPGLTPFELVIPARALA